jgi:septin 2
MEQVQQNGIQVYTLPECDDDEDEEYKEQCKQLKVLGLFAFCITLLSLLVSSMHEQ